MCNRASTFMPFRQAWLNRCRLRTSVLWSLQVSKCQEKWCRLKSKWKSKLSGIKFQFSKCCLTWKPYAAPQRFPWHIAQSVGWRSASCSTSASCWSPGRSCTSGWCSSCSCTLSTLLPRIFACCRGEPSVVLVASVPCFDLDSLPARLLLTGLHQLPEEENGLFDPLQPSLRWKSRWRCLWSR